MQQRHRVLKLKYLKYGVAVILLSLSIKYVFQVFEADDLKGFVGKLNGFRFFAVNSLLYLIYWYLRTLRWRALLKSKMEMVSWFQLFKTMVFALSVGVVSPFQSGEALKIGMLKKLDPKFNLRWLTQVFFVEKIQDLLFLILVFLVGLLFQRFESFALIEFGGSSIMLLLIGAGILVGVAIFILRVSRIRFNWDLGLSFLYTILSWIVTALIWQNSVMSVGLDLALLDSVFAVSVVMIVMLLSFVPGGIGVAEVTSLVVLSELGAVESTARLGVISLRVMGLYSVVFGLIVYYLLKLSRKECYESC